MPALWLTWKAKFWPVEKLRDLVRRVRDDPTTTEPWRISAHKQAAAGDRVYLFAQGEGRRGIFGVGELAAPPALNPVESPNPEKPQHFAPVRFLKLVDPTREMLLPLEDLRNLVPATQIEARASGTTVAETVAAELDRRLGLSGSGGGGRSHAVRQDWTQRDVDACVAAYVEMLDNERAGKPYRKVDYNRRVQAVTGRSQGAVEFKFQNISAVLDDLGLRWLPGYRPADHAQSAAIKDALERRLGEDEALRERLEPALPPEPEALVPSDPESVFADAPPKSDVAGATAAPPPGATVGKFDRAQQDANNKKLGNDGERFVLQVERRRLEKAGRRDLARKVEWVSKTQGDGLGYDIRSYNPDGTERLIEVKTTKGGKTTPFYVTANEVAVSETEKDRYWLYRVFNYADKKEPKIYMKNGPIGNGWHLKPTEFRATL